MKHRIKRVLALLLALMMLCSFPVNAFAFTSKNIFTSSTITHQDRFKGYDLVQGIDVSYHNGAVNWAKVKNAGVKFVILRAGYRGYAKEGNIKKDTNFDSYIKGAAAQGLDIGIYFYSQAVTPAEARAEANFTLNVIKNYKKYITLPVAYDYEFAEVSSGRLDSAWHSGKLNRAKMTANCEAFCDTVKAAGYLPMIYASKSFFEEKLNYTTLDSKYTIWVAHYATKTGYKGDFNLWQFTSKGKIGGISGNVDANFMYVEPMIYSIPNQVYTGKALKPAVTVKAALKTLTAGKDYTVTYSNNTNYGTATAVVKGLGAYASTVSKTLHFNIVPQTVKNLTVTDKTTTGFILHWDKTGDADGYELSLVNAEGKHTVINNFDKDTDECKFTTAKPATMYTYSVRGFKKVGGKTHYAAYSALKKVTTAPTQGTTLKVTGQTENTISVSWNTIGHCEKYYLYRYDNENEKWVYLATGAKTGKATLKKLTPNTDYKLCMVPVKLDENGKELKGKKSENTKAFTTPNPVKKFKSVTAHSRRRIKTKWKQVKGVKGYEIMWSTTKNFTSNTKSVLVPAGNNKTVLQAYRAKTKYYVRMRTYTERGGKTYYSAWSKKVKIKTKK